MLVRITRRPSQDNVDGISLSCFKVGLVYALPVPLATLMISEAWAVPVSESNAVTLPEIKFQTFPSRERRLRVLSHRRLRLELGIAADRRRKHKKKR
jgi:hypothetical protein